MSRTKQSIRGRSKPHQKRSLALRKRKNKRRAKQRAARSRPHRRQGSKR